MDQAFTRFAPELISTIAKLLHRRDAFALALTSRQCVKPAESAIWEHLTSFSPLLCCLDKQLLVEIPKGPVSLGGRQTRAVLFGGTKASVDQDQNPHRPLTIADLAAYRRLSVHIRTFKLDLRDSNDREIHLPTISLLKVLHRTLRLAGAHPCPGLQSTDIRFFRHVQALTDHEEGEDQPEAVDECLFFFSKTAKCITLDIPSETDALVRRLGETLCQSHLASINLTSCPTLKSLAPLVQQNLHTRIQHAQIDALTPPQVLALGHFPNLKSLTCWISEETSDDNSTDTVPDLRSESDAPYPFPALTQLRTSADHASHLYDLLERFQHKVGLETLRITLERCGTLPSNRRLLDAISNRSNPDAMTELAIEDGVLAEDLQFPGGEPLNMELGDTLHLTPLYGFRALTRVNIILQSGVHTSPTILDEYNSAWPSMEYFQILSLYPVPQTPYIDHHDLMRLVSKWKCLEHLGLRFDASRIKGSELGPWERTPSLKSLRVGSSPIVSAERVAAFLEANFERLEELTIDEYSHFNSPTLNERRWKATQMYLGLRD